MLLDSLETSVLFLYATSTRLLVAENLDVKVFYLLAYAYFNLLNGEQGISVYYFEHICEINSVKHCEFVRMTYVAA